MNNLHFSDKLLVSVASVWCWSCRYSRPNLFVRQQSQECGRRRGVHCALYRLLFPPAPNLTFSRLNKAQFQTHVPHNLNGSSISRDLGLAEWLWLITEVNGTQGCHLQLPITAYSFIVPALRKNLFSSTSFRLRLFTSPTFIYYQFPFRQSNRWYLNVDNCHL